MKRNVLCLIVAMVMLVPLFAADRALAKEKPIKIGFTTDLTSFLSINGIPGRQAAILAMEQAGYEIAGRPVKMIIEDEASDPAIAMDRARKMVETDKVCMIIGPFHGGCAAAVAGYAIKVGIPNIAIWYNQSNEEMLKYTLTWGPWGTGQQLTYAAGVYASEVLGYRTATAMATDYSYGHVTIDGFKTAFEERGGKVIQQQWIPLGTADIAPYIGALKKADVLVPWLAGVTATVGLKQIKEFGVKMPVVMPQTGFPAHPKQIVEIGDDGLGIITSEAYVWTLPGPKNKAFVDAYQARWGEMPSGAAYGAYAAVQIGLEALRKTGGDTSAKALAKALDKTELEGILGTFRFADAHVGIGNYFIHKAIKVNGEYRTEILAYYTIGTEKVGDKLIQKIIDKEIVK
jgi:branched-chain amino acid transport system substrate-binding protein